MSDPGSGEDPPEEDAAGFADLVGETRPLKGNASKRAPRPTQTPPRRPRPSGQDDPKTRFRQPDPNEPRLAGRNGVSDRQLRDLARGEPVSEERIDLHGVRRDGGDRLLAGRLRSAAERGLRCVVVIHGRGKGSESGEAVLREEIPEWLTRGRSARFVLGFAPAPQSEGGAGATRVLVRRSDAS